MDIIVITLLALLILTASVGYAVFLIVRGKKGIWYTPTAGMWQMKDRERLHADQADWRGPMKRPVRTAHAMAPNAELCPGCGEKLPEDSPEGLCPRCLLESGMSDSVHALANGGVDTGAYKGQLAAPDPADLARHFPQLEILKFLGQGGMGAVYKARQPKLDRLVAVKVLPPEWGKDPAFAERFAREAKALARLNHPHIVAVHDFGESDGLFYLIMEYVDGANLRHVMNEGRLAPGEALAIIPQICEALEYAHEEGIVHRDIKPENILLDSKGRVKIADFGLAKLLGRSRASFTLTGTHQVMGTLDYMAPEQRQSPQEVDHRADIYSLGVVFYEMLTGELPLGRFAPPSQSAGVDARLDEVVYRALEREPQRRYQRASQVKNDVESIAGGLPPIAPREGRRESPRPVLESSTDSFQFVGPAAGLLLTGVIGMLFWTVMGLGHAVTSARFSRHGEHLWFLLMPLLGILAGLVLIVGAWKMMRLRPSPWSVAASIWAMFPWSPGWLIGLPCGIWALTVLLRRENRQALGTASQRQGYLVTPATGLIVVGVLAWFFWTILGLCLFANEPPSRNVYQQFYDRQGRLNTSYLQEPNSERFLFLLMPLLATPAAAVLVLGGRRMLQSRSYQFAVLTSMWAMLPWSPFWAFGLAFGVWALITLRNRQVQLAFGQPFRAGGAFEQPSVGARAAPAPQPTGPVRRRLRGFLGSMYSLVVASRPQHESLGAEANSPSAANFPLPAPEAPRAAYIPRPEKGSATGSRRRAWLLWGGLALGTLLTLCIVVESVVRARAQRELAEHARLVQNTVPQGVLKPQYTNLVTTLGLDRYGLERQVGEVFRTTEDEYLALESSFTKRERDTDGHLKVTVLPFKDDVDQLEERFWAKLESILWDHNLKKQARDQLPRKGSLFPFGKEEARIELWHEGKWYHGRVFRGMADKSTEQFDGPQLPKAYARFWAR
jgi:tRNA A-37 threonylcarbamoyl transferase component Bud32